MDLRRTGCPAGQQQLPDRGTSLGPKIGADGIADRCPTIRRKVRGWEMGSLAHDGFVITLFLVAALVAGVGWLISRLRR
jgi:hypothetical protein